MKTVLIPTDFSITSLQIVQQAATYFSMERIKVVLFHALHMPGDIQDLLSMNSQVPHEKITETFRHTCATLKRKHKDVISHISFQYIYGNTAAVFRNFTTAHAIDCLFLPAHVQLQRPYQHSVDVRPLFKQSTLPFITTIASIATPKKSSSFVYANDLILADK